MATNLPNTIPGLVDWSSVHSSLWTQNQANIGISAGQLNSFKALVQAFQSANTTAQQARDASKNATKILTEATAEVRASAGQLINLIKAFAEATHNPNVYALAGVSADEPASPVAPPNAPEIFTTTVNADGSLTISWKVTQPVGVNNVVYQVKRRFNANQEWMLIGSAGSEKTFTDVTLPYGTDAVQYIIQPKRGNTFGPQSDVLAIQFGSVGPGLQQAA